MRNFFIGEAYLSIPCSRRAESCYEYGRELLFTILNVAPAHEREHRVGADEPP